MAYNQLIYFPFDSGFDFPQLYVPNETNNYEEKIYYKDVCFFQKWPNRHCLVVMRTSEKSFNCKILYFTPSESAHELNLIADLGFHSLDFSADWRLVWNTNIFSSSSSLLAKIISIRLGKKYYHRHDDDGRVQHQRILMLAKYIKLITV